MKADEEIRQMGWYQKALNGSGLVGWEYMAIPNNILNRRLYLTLTMYVSYGSVKDVGTVLTISINPQSKTDIVLQEFYETMIIDNEGIIIAAKNHSLFGTRVDEMFDEFAYDSNKTVIYSDAQSMLLSSVYTQVNSNECFVLLSIIPVLNIDKDARNAAYTGWAIMAASLVIALLLIIAFSNIFSRRISVISNNMHNVAAGGDFDSIGKISGNDEIGRLADDMDVMIWGIKNLMEEINRANDQKSQLMLRQKDIRFRMLANQINPLESIRMKAFSKGEKEISEAVLHLGKIMRKSLEAGSKPIEIEIELDLVKNYLKLQKFRYGNRISFAISHEDNDIVHRKILPFTIQPIVENSVVHGFEESGGELFISIDIRYHSNDIIISVEDNGAGMNAKEVSDLLSSFDD